MAEGILDLTKLNKRLWLVKVPENVAQQWRGLCEQAMNPSSLEDDAPPVQLGSVRVEATAEQQAAGEYSMLLIAPGPAAGSEPQTYRMDRLLQAPGATNIALSYREQPDGGPAANSTGNTSTLFAEGTVDVSFNAAPSLKFGPGAASGQVSQSYAELNKERTLKASTKDRVIQTYEDTREQNLSRMYAEKAGRLSQRQRLEEQKKAREVTKRVKLDPDTLERELFRLFERQATWPMAKLMQETGQQSSQIKEILSKIAVFNKRGPNRDTYQLKKEYAGGMHADAAANETAGPGPH